MFIIVFIHHYFFITTLAPYSLVNREKGTFCHAYIRCLSSLPVVTGIVVRCLSRWSLGSRVAPRHTTVNNKIGSVDEAALVAGKEKNSLGLLDGFTETASGEVDFAAVTLDLVVAEPVLEERSAVHVSTMASISLQMSLLQWCWAKSIEPEALPSVHHRQLPRHCQNRALAGCVG
jgi:hypothetical protein